MPLNKETKKPTKGTKILLFQAERYTVNTDIIRYYLLPNSTVLKLCKEEKRVWLEILFGIWNLKQTYTYIFTVTNFCSGTFVWYMRHR